MTARSPLPIALLIPGLLLVSLTLSAAAPPSPVARLVRQLGSESFAEREAASRALERLGEPALPLLRKATRHPDLEVRVRAARLVRLIQGRLDRVDFPGEPPPSGAIVLFGGKSLGGWTGRDGKSRADWKLLPGGVMECRGGDIMTRRSFTGRFRLHVEFRVPDMPRARGQGRGNSGVYVQGRYEVQILDSHALPPDRVSCGAIYGLAAPAVNACKAPLAWQSFDIDFRAPIIREGRKVKHARLSVRHNGVKIHGGVDLVRATPSGLPGDLASPGPVLLQGHGCPVQFRNVWLLPLTEPRD